MTVLEKWQVNSLTIVHCVLTIFMNEHELTGEGKVAPISLYRCKKFGCRNRRMLGFGTFAYATDI